MQVQCFPLPLQLSGSLHGRGRRGAWLVLLLTSLNRRRCCRSFSSCRCSYLRKGRGDQRTRRSVGFSGEDKNEPTETRSRTTKRRELLYHMIGLLKAANIHPSHLSPENSWWFCTNSCNPSTPQADQPCGPLELKQARSFRISAASCPGRRGMPQGVLINSGKERSSSCTS